MGVLSGVVMVLRDDTHVADLETELKAHRQFHRIVGRSEPMQKVYALIRALARVQTTVLITGESGTGKELVAEALHRAGERGHKPLVKVNCSALPETLLESELFGHVKGAFTGAIRDSVGRFHRADGGTIFFDEIGDISPIIQLKLLRVLEEREFERVGSSTPTKVDVRLIAATN
jgi:transcriptional regulator with GAF, ATPase, and Fis domain